MNILEHDFTTKTLIDLKNRNNINKQIHIDMNSSIETLIEEQSEMQRIVAELVSRSTELLSLLGHSPLKSKLQESEVLTRKGREEIQEEKKKLNEHRNMIEQLEANTKIQVEKQQKMIEERKTHIEQLSDKLTKIYSDTQQN